MNDPEDQSESARSVSGEAQDSALDPELEGFDLTPEKPTADEALESTSFDAKSVDESTLFTGEGEPATTPAFVTAHGIVTQRAAEGDCSGPPDDWPTVVYARIANDPAQLAFFHALALQNECPASAVYDAAGRLERVLRAGERVDPEAPTVFSMPKPLAELLSVCSGERYTDCSRGTPVEALRFPSAAYSERVIRHVWSEYGYTWRNDLSRWIRQTGESSERISRLAAGSAAGVLARSDFDSIQRAILNAWFSSPRTGPLDALDAALTVIAESDELRERAHAMVLRWAQSSGPNPIWASSWLARGLYGQHNNAIALSVAECLLHQGRTLAFERAQAVYAWLVRQHRDDPERAGEIIHSWNHVAGDGTSSAVLQRDLIVLQLLHATAHHGGEAATFVDSALANDSARVQLADMVIAMFGVSDFMRAQAGIESTAKDLMAKLLEDPVRRDRPDSPGLRLLRSMIEQSVGRDRDGLHRWLKILLRRFDRFGPPGIQHLASAVDSLNDH